MVTCFWGASGIIHIKYLHKKEEEQQMNENIMSTYWTHSITNCRENNCIWSSRNWSSTKTKQGCMYMTKLNELATNCSFIFYFLWIWGVQTRQRDDLNFFYVKKIPSYTPSNPSKCQSFIEVMLFSQIQMLHNF